MLNREDRFYAPSGAIYPGGPSFWHVIDWDQRRLVSVKMDQEQESPDLAFDCLLKHIDHLPPDVYLIHLSPSGNILSMSNDPKDDETLCVFRPPLSAAQLPDGIATISRAELQEVGRLGPNVDLVVYPNSAKPDGKVRQKIMRKWRDIPATNVFAVSFQVLLPLSTPRLRLARDEPLVSPQASQYCSLRQSGC